MKDPWEDWEGLQARIEDRFWDELIAIAEALGELEVS